VSVSTRNARLVALRSWFAFAAHRHPEHAALIARVLAIPSKRDRPLVSFLEPDEADALLKAPGTGRWTGRRDRVLLTFAVQTGLRVSELTAVRNADIALGRGAHVQVLGKGRKERAVPLSSHTVAALRPWLSERAEISADQSSPAPAGNASAATQCESSSSSTRARQQRTAPRSLPRKSAFIPFATPAR
jgi:integrase/recombinase XerD